MGRTAISVAESFGYMTTAEVRGLQALAMSITKPNPVFVNVGAGSGTSGLALAEANNSAIRYTVDITNEDSPFGGLPGEINAFRETKLTPPFQIHGDSRNVARSWEKRVYGAIVLEYPIDLIFIDDGHLYEDIKGDIECWTPHVAPGGIISFHDYGKDVWPDVKEVVDQYFRDPILYIDTLIAFRK